MGDEYISFKVTLSKDLQETYKVAHREVKAAMRDELKKIGVEGEERMKRSMQNTGKAHWFYRRPDGAIHWPSAPGYAPAIDSGRLFSSIVLDTADESIEIGSEEKSGFTDYAFWLNEGTSKMAARPFVDNVGEWIESVIENRIYKRMMNTI